VVTSTIAYEGNAAWREYEGGVTDWLTQSKRANELIKSSGQKASQPSKYGRSLLSNNSVPETAPATAGTAAAASKARKLSYKEQRELDELPELIAKLEAEQKDINALLADGSLYAVDNTRALKLATRGAEIDDALLTALERWEFLGSPL
jgi:ATP-binding cassette subfamily F protein uup